MSGIAKNYGVSVGYRILIVEDDDIISLELLRYLSKWGNEAKTVKDFTNVLEEFIEFNPQLVLMDIGLPFFNGYHWCSEIRRFSKVPIIFISSANDNMNIVMAMNMGGDDFIVKPFDLEVLSAKVMAMLRRTYSFTNEVNLLEYKGVILNLSDASAAVNSKKIDLTKNEFRILEILFENKENVVSREKIMEKLWDSDCFIDDNTLTVNMTRLRKKLEEAGIKNIIQTKKGIGYLLGE